MKIRNARRVMEEKIEMEIEETTVIRLILCIQMYIKIW